MAGKFVSLDDAAKLLGMSPDELKDLRSQGEIYGYRDGASWKFKMEELSRVAQERGTSLEGQAADIEVPEMLGDSDEEQVDLDKPLTMEGESSVGDLLADDALSEDSDDADSLLVSDEDLGHPAESSSSTIIGKNNGDGADSDLQIASSDEHEVLGSEGNLAGSDVGSSILGSETPETGPGSSDVKLVAEENGSDVKLVADSSDDLLVESGSTGSQLELDSGTGTGDLDTPSTGSGDLELSAGSGTGDLDVDSELTLESDSLEADDLSLSEDDDLVLGDSSGAGSDVTLGAGDTGINLTSPSDSGLSLEEEPVELGSSVSSLELPEDEVALTEGEADPDAATQLKQDEEFLLSPSDTESDEDDSGSQVIALEDSTGLDQDAATLLSGDAFAQAQPAQAPLEPVAAEPGAMAPGAMAPGVAEPAAAAPQAVEAPYTIWNVLPLLAIVAVLGLAGVLMMDVVRNMWGWETADAPVSTSIMEGMLKAFQLK